MVTTHCFTSEAARTAIEGGVGGIEHGNLLDGDTLKLMAAKGIHLTPTLVAAEVGSDHRVLDSFLLKWADSLLFSLASRWSHILHLMLLFPHPHAIS